MEGFFNQKEVEIQGVSGGRVRSCAACGLYNKCITPKLKPYGNFKKQIMLIGSAPSSLYDQQKVPWKNKSGKLLKRSLSRIGIDVYEDCITLNAVNCYTKDPPTHFQIECCRKSMFKYIDEYQPKMIILLGMDAVYSVIGNRWRRDIRDITLWRGWTIPDRQLKSWLCPIFHPGTVLSADEDGKIEYTTVWENDLKNIEKHIDQKLPKYRQPKIEYITDLSVLSTIKTDRIAFDYETTGIKPHAAGHRIICTSVAKDENHVYTFPMPKTRKERQPFIDLLKNSSIGKMAHNMKYEETWSKVRLRQSIVNWEWDSMLAAHIFDNRKGITSLKFQVYVNFGIIDYEAEVADYLKSNKKGANEINNIQSILNIPDKMKALLKYCALDSIYQFRLATIQQKKMDYSFLPF